jgi:hypothetical protein
MGAERERATLALAAQEAPENGCAPTRALGGNRTNENGKHRARRDPLNRPDAPSGRAGAQAGAFPFQAGSILLHENVLLPSSVQIESRTWSRNWRQLTRPDGTGLDRSLRAAGWSFMFLAQRFETMIFGSASEKRVRAAMRRLLNRTEAEHFNSLEVTDVSRRSFLRIPYVVVSAHPRHIQGGKVLLSKKDRREAEAMTVSRGSGEMKHAA